LEPYTGDSDYPDYSSEETSLGSIPDIATEESMLSDED
jgi:hypothetical protein